MNLNLPVFQKYVRWIYSGVGISFLLWFLFVLFSRDFSIRGLDGAIADILGPISDWLSTLVFYEFTFLEAPVQIIVLWMALPMIILTVYFGFINFWGFRHAYDILRGKFLDPKAPGEVSQVQALATALSGTVGIGNIAGVAFAISVGGPGAALWMLMIGILAMAVKFAECTLAVKYRIYNEDGTVSGGPMYYLLNGLKNRGLPTLGVILAVLYAVLTLPSIIQWVQINQAFSQVSSVTGMENGLVFGLILAGVTGLVIIGGIKSIAKVTVRLVPLMAAIYFLAALVILFSNFSQIPDAVFTIFREAFDPQSVKGGIIGAIIIGMRRAVYSTEAGLGSSSIAHAAAKTREPVSEGYVGLMEPFIDVLIGSMTALLIVITGAYTFTHPVTGDPLGDIQMTSAAFATVFDWFPIILALAVLLFAFSTIISWSYYLEKVWTFLFGGTKRSIKIYKVVFILLLIPGAVLTPEKVFNLMDSIFFLLAIPNILGLYFMAPELKADLKDYLARLKAGKIPTAKTLAKKA
ncbi:MAG: alanine/glycine:cation symporter family protein [Alphaproteobacteria bacterium]